MIRLRYVIIGNSAAGVFAAEAIRKRDKQGTVDIVSDEKYPAYARCMTSYYLTGQLTEEDLFIRPRDFYSKQDLNLHLCEKVIGIDSGIRKVHTNIGSTYNYDKLLIASGASATMPKIPGAENGGVFCLRSLNDSNRIRQFSGPNKRAVIVGGGFVALKAAYALLKAGMIVTCIISSGQILSQMLDQEAAGIVSSVLISGGLTVKYHNDVVEIMSKNDSAKGNVVSGVKLASGEEMPADVVIFGKGVTPNTGFLEGSGINLDKGILVDEHMQTSIPDIYAAGDVAQAYDITSGRQQINAIWPNATEQGTVAGENMTGLKAAYPGSVGMNSADFFGLSTIAAGQTRVAEENYETVVLFPGSNLYRRLVFNGDVLVGYIMVGRTAKAGILTSLVKEKVPLGKMKDELIMDKINLVTLLHTHLTLN